MKGLLLLAALELAFLATNYSNLFFLLIVFCCVLGGLGLLAGVANVRRARVQLAPAPAAAAGSPRQVRVAFDGRRTCFDLAMALETDAGLVDLAHVPFVRGPSVLDLGMPGLARGIHRAARLRISSRHPFGLFEVRTVLPVAAEIVTHPKPDEGGAARTVGAQDQERAPRGSPGAGVAGLREFRVGDALTDVHWKASARRGTPVVKERERESGEVLDVVVDRRCAAGELEAALSIAAGFVLAVRSGGRPIRLQSQGYAAEVGNTGDSAREALRWLAGATPLPGNAAPVARARAGGIRLPRDRQEPARA